jgi:hypothetical protein
MPKNFERRIQHHALAFCSSTTRHTNLHYNFQKFKWSSRHSQFSSSTTQSVQCPGQSFAPKGSQCLSSDGIHQAAFALRCFANRGPRDSLLSGIIACSRWPIPRGSVRPQSRVGTMRRAMLMKLQSLFCLPIMEL